MLLVTELIKISSPYYIMQVNQTSSQSSHNDSANCFDPIFIWVTESNRFISFSVHSVMAIVHHIAIKSLMRNRCRAPNKRTKNQKKSISANKILPCFNQNENTSVQLNKTESSASFYVDSIMPSCITCSPVRPHIAFAVRK